MLSKLIISFLAVAMISTGAAAQERTTPEAPTPAEAPKEENILYLDLSTGGRVAIQLYPAMAPNHVERIKALTRQGFYDGVIFHRVIEGFMAQTGDPTGTGTGGSELPDLKAEFHAYPHLRGVVSMARAEGEDSANSQFFIVLYPRFALDKKYTVFGRVTEGMGYVDAINRGEPPAIPSRILQASIAADGKAPPPPRSVAPVSETPTSEAPPSEAGTPEENITVDDLNTPIEP